MRLGRRFLGNDLNPEAVRIAAQRLRDFGEGRVPEGLPEEVPPPQADLFDEVRPQVRLKPDTTYPTT